jgi:hemerythrin
MGQLIWTDDLNTGIDIIDNQHRRIAEMINHLNAVLNSRSTGRNSRSKFVRTVIEELVDYTLSHFAFEEALMEDSGYPFTSGHKRLHRMLGKHVAEYRARNQAGEDVAKELHGLLNRWLFSHIRNEDAAYVREVKSKIRTTRNDLVDGWLARSLRHFFPSRSPGARRLER